MENLLKQNIRTLILLKIENKILKDTFKSLQKEEPKTTLLSEVINIINIIVFDPAKYFLFTTIELFTGYKF